MGPVFFSVFLINVWLGKTSHVKSLKFCMRNTPLMEVIENLISFPGIAQMPGKCGKLKRSLNYHDQLYLISACASQSWVGVCMRVWTQTLEWQTRLFKCEAEFSLGTFVFFLCNVYCLTTPKRGWFQCWFRRPHAVPPHKGLPWLTQARRSHSRCPCGSPRPSAAFAGTWQHTASPLLFHCTSSPPQTFPWETKRGESERVISEEAE